MLSIKRKSKWRFKTSSSGGIDIGFVGVSAGNVTLISPQGQETKFHYSGVGGGASVGITLAQGQFKLPVSANFAAEAFPSAGQLFILHTYPGQELRRSDITGGCVIGEISGNSIVGGSATAMLLGMQQKFIERDIESDLVQLGLVAGYGGPGGKVLVEALDKVGLLQNSATAVLIMAGYGISASVGAGITGRIGTLS
ncbi:MAG TPA: hypothetical protein VKU19_18270 [Bryobacteraceae bacterium]|nr:hypothetical protein [Bryobacteraceae bacterium]